MVRALLLILAALGAVPATAAAEGDFLVIAHRGASGERPEHTLAAYERDRRGRTSAVQAGARNNAKLFHRHNPVTQLATYGPMWLAGRAAPKFVHARNDWIYGHDVTAGLQNKPLP